MELPQKVWPYGNVMGSLVIKYLEFLEEQRWWINSGAPIKCLFSSLAFVLGKIEGIADNTYLEGSNEK